MNEAELKKELLDSPRGMGVVGAKDSDKLPTLFDPLCCTHGSAEFSLCTSTHGVDLALTVLVHGLGGSASADKATNDTTGYSKSGQRATADHPSYLTNQPRIRHLLHNPLVSWSVHLN